MTFGGLLNSFNGSVAGKVFVGRRAGRYIGAFMDAFGQENFIQAVKNGKYITDFMETEHKIHLKNMALNYRHVFAAFTDDDVYNWIPENYRELLQSMPGGIEYGIGQVQEIRRFLES